MSARETEQTAVGRLEKKVAELTARLLRWQAFATRKAIELRETRISLSHLLRVEAEGRRAAAADNGKRGPHAGPRSEQRMVGRRKLEPSVAETKRWAVEGTCFGLNWIEVERASHATKKAALADMRAIAKKMPHLQLRVVVVVERRDVVARSGAKPPNVEVCDGGRKTSESKQDANRHSQH